LSTTVLLELLTDTDEMPTIREDCHDELTRRLQVGEIRGHWRPMIGEALAVPIPSVEATWRILG